MNKTPDDLMLSLFLLGAAIPVLVYLFVILGKLFIEKLKLEKNYLSSPRLIEYRDYYTCSGKHDWLDTYLVLRGLEPGKYKVCTQCGMISGVSEYMLNDVALQQIQERLKLKQLQKDLMDQTIKNIEDLAKLKIKKYIEDNFSNEINDIHFSKKLDDLIDFSIEAIKDAEKVTIDPNDQMDFRN